MSDIVITKNDEVDIIVKSNDSGIVMELSEFFTFYVPGYRFMPAYKNKVWDGKIRLFNRMTGELNAGLYVYLHRFCSERNYDILVEKSKYGLPGQIEPLVDLDAYCIF